MNRKSVSGMMLTLLLINALTLTFDTQQTESSEFQKIERSRTYGEGPYGPTTSNLLVHIYPNPHVRNEALESGEIDIDDWPMSKYWMDRWFDNPDITMRSYCEVGHVEFDLNNQRWPTGVSTPRVYDPVTDSYKHFYGMPGTELAPPDLQAKGYHTVDDLATAFRTAIAFLADKDAYVTEIHGGLAYRQDTQVPAPALGWTDFDYLKETGRIYPYAPWRAAELLDDAGFVQGTTYNRYHDPVGADSLWSAKYMRIDPLTGEDLEPLEFWIRMDDLSRRDAGWMLVRQLRKHGIPVNVHETERTVCYENVMVNYDYHIYTGSWSLSMDVPCSFSFLCNSGSYWGGTATSEKGGIGWSPNYLGFCNNWTEADSWYHTNQARIGLNGKGESKRTPIGAWFDELSYDAMNAENLFELFAACGGCQANEQDFVPKIPLWSEAEVKAFKSSWTGVVNMPGYGIDNRWSFLNMGNPADDVIDWGICSNLEGPHPIVSGPSPTLSTAQSDMRRDWKIVDLTYDTLIGRNPYQRLGCLGLPEEFGWLAQDWTNGTWTMPGGDEAHYYTFTLRPGVIFHNGDPLTPQDVKFSLEFTKACGPGVAWVYNDVQSIHHVNTQAEEPTLGANQVKVYMNTKSSFLEWGDVMIVDWGLHLAGMTVPILNKNLWMVANAVKGWGYEYGMTDYHEFTNRSMVRDYMPWQEDVDGNGAVDLADDGTGPWIFQDYTPKPIIVSTTISFTANTNFYLSQAYVEDYLKWAFHVAGDVDDDGDVDASDGYLIAKSMGSDETWPHGTGWYQYNPEADIAPDHAWDMATGVGTHGDGKVDIDDLSMFDRNYGMVG